MTRRHTPVRGRWRVPARLVALAAVAVLGLAAVACGRGEERGVYADMLRLVPDEPGPVQVMMGDVARYRELAGIELPDGELDSEAYLDALRSSSDVPDPGVQFIARGDASRVADNAQSSLGFALQDVDQWLIALQADEPMGRFAIRGHFEPDKVDDHLEACAECPSGERIEYRDETIYAWGGDDELGAGSPFSPPLFDNLGRGCCIAVEDRYVLRAYSRDGVKAMLDAEAGDGSLTGDDDFRLAAEALDELGPLQAFVTDDPPDRADAERLAERAAELDEPLYRRTWGAWIESSDAELLRPYAVLAYGPGYSASDGLYLAVALVHDSAEAARESVERFPSRLDAVVAGESPSGERETWGDRFDRVDVEVDGRVVRARLWSDRAYPPDLHLMPLFMHE